MKASSVEWEISITLLDEELRVLKESALVSKMVRYSQTEKLGEIPLRIERGKTSRENLFMDLLTTPHKVYWETAREYKIIISDLGYETLKEDRLIVERLYRNPGCKIFIKINGPEGI